MKFLKVLLVINSFSIVPLPITVMVTNNQFKIDNSNQKLKLLELNSFENLFLDIVQMIENNTFWNTETLRFDHWKNGKTSDVLNEFNLLISKIYEDNFKDKDSSLKPLRADLDEEIVIKDYSVDFRNNSQSDQKWTTPGYQAKVTNLFSYTLTDKKVVEHGGNWGVKFPGFGGSNSVKISTSETESKTVESTQEKTVFYDPQEVMVSAYHQGKATYQIRQGSGQYFGMLTSVNTPPFELRIPTFYSSDDKEIKITLTAKDLLEGLKKEGYDLHSIGVSAETFSIISYDDRKPIEMIDSFTYNIEINWSTNLKNLEMKYTEVPL